MLGRRTRSALRRAERRAGLRADGRPDTDILERLGVDVLEREALGRNGRSSAPAGDTAAFVSAAKAKIGSPYAGGATGPGSFDCSGLVVYAAQRAGRSVPRSSFAQFQAGEAVKRSEIEPGDLVFFSTAGSGASDVGIATSATTVVSATTHGVMEHAIDDGYWGANYLGARRVA